MALENNKTITLHLNDSNRKILEPIAEEAQAKGISLSAAVIEKLTALSKPLADPVIVETPEPVEDADYDREESEAEVETETEAETHAVESNDSPVTKITLNLTAFSDEDEYYKVKIEREDGTSETMEWVPDEVADDGDNTEENVLQLISNNNISPETQIAVEVLADDVDIEIDDDDEEDKVVTRTATLADLDSKAVRKQLGFNEEEDEIYSDLKEILKSLKDLEQLREDYPMGQVAEVEAIRDDDDYDDDYDEDDEEDYDEDEDEDYDEEEDEDEDEEREYGNGGSYDDYPW